MERMFFIEQGLVSVFGASGRRKLVEISLIGSAGMSGVEVVLQDNEPPLQRIVQVDGEAWQIECQDLVAIIEKRPEIRRLLLRYAMFVQLQTAQIGICNASHRAEQRVSRWLLQARDALDRNRLPLTHRMLARILGVRRATVTHVLGALERRGATRIGRGAVLIDSPERLNERACDCGRLISREYQRLIGHSCTMLDETQPIRPSTGANQSGDVPR